MTNEESTNPLKKQMEKQAEKEQLEKQSKTKVYLVSFNINDVTGSLVVGAQSIPKAIEKFLSEYGSTSEEWNTMSLVIEETSIL